MAVQPESSLCVSKEQLQRQVGGCALCNQPATEQGCIAVACVDAWSRTYRWHKWITHDPKKIKALTFAYAVTLGVIAFPITLNVMHQLVLPNENFWVFSGFLPLLFLASKTWKTPWSDVQVQIPMCDKHARSSKNSWDENARSAWIFWAYGRSFEVTVFFLVAYGVSVLIYAGFIATGDAALKFFLMYFALPAVILCIGVSLINWILGIRRFFISPYGVSSGSDIIEIWHFSPSYCNAVKADTADANSQFFA